MPDVRQILLNAEHLWYESNLGHRHYFAVLTRNQFAILQLLLKGRTITQAIVAACKKAAISEKEISELFSLIAAPGVMQSVNHPPNG